MNMLAVVVDGDSVRVIARTRGRRVVSMCAAVRNHDGMSVRPVACARRGVIMYTALVDGDVVTMRTRAIDCDGVRMCART